MYKAPKGKKPIQLHKPVLDPLSPNDHWIPTYGSLSEMSSSAEHAEEGETHTDQIIQDVNELVRVGYSRMMEKPGVEERREVDLSGEQEYNRLVGRRVKKEKQLHKEREILRELIGEEQRLGEVEGEKANTLASLQSKLTELHSAIAGFESDDEKYVFVSQRCELTNSLLRYRSSLLTSELDQLTQEINSAEDVILVDENWTQTILKQRYVTESYIQSMRQQRVTELANM